MKPVKDYLKISLEEKQQKQEGGLILPSSSFNKKKNIGTVVEIGQDTKISEGVIGKQVLFLRDENVEEIQEGDVKFAFVPVENVVAYE